MNIEKYIAIYFKKTNKIISAELSGEIITIQFFQRKETALLSGMSEVIDLLKKNSDISKYQIKYLPDGSLITAMEVVLELTGEYKHFGALEGIIDSILARATSVSTNAYLLKQATNKELVFMGDRSDHYSNQERDGLAASIGGITKQVTQAHIAYHDGVALGTMPHVLIQAFKGNLVAALQGYEKHFPNEKLTALVDFHNDVIAQSLQALKVFGKKLGAVRVDTPKNLRDKMFKSNENEYGVTPLMVKRLRKSLDDHDGNHVKIIISSGINLEMVKQFEKVNTPVDIYGVGSAIIDININFSADAVKVNGRKIAKTGRGYRKNEKLITYISK